MVEINQKRTNLNLSMRHTLFSLILRKKLATINLDQLNDEMEVLEEWEVLILEI